ncbi:MAG: biopolymer transporter ExbD [Desulfomonilia bacterium]|jgi:biopolymer transport protein ExbD|nr:biopolymer transporter ExbD [Deltaproteobacteria bacterium]MDX9762157.1 biopolymer transporter ExbD [Desulfomonilia bacterium]
MIRIRHKPKKNSDFMSIEMTPLVDVVFLLLIFFLLTTSYINPSMDLNLPEAKTSQINDHVDPYTIAIAQDGSFTINQAPAVLGDIAKIPSGSDVLVLEDKAGPFGVFIGVLDTLRENGHTKISIVTDEKAD